MSHQLQQSSHAAIVGKRYRLISQLGMGGFGQTFLAQDLHLPDCPRCVVKRLITQSKDPKHLQTARRLFNTEARVLYQLGSHDQIPSLFAHFEENQGFYLVQEFIEGEPLTRQILKGKPWPEDRVIVLLEDILEVLVFVHQQNVIHRDVKPSNLMRRRRDGKIVLIDFGAVKHVSVQSADPNTDIADSTVSIGTKGYIPNEQLAGKPRFSSDIYAVGLVGIQALTGVLPKELGEDAQTSELDWRLYVPSVSNELADVLDRMVRYDFRDRYPTAVEALAALRNLSPEVTEFQTQLFHDDDPVLSVHARPISSQIATPQVDMGGATSMTDPKEETLTLAGNTASMETSDLSQGVSSSERPTVLSANLWQHVQTHRWAALSSLAIVGLVLAIAKFTPLLNPLHRSLAPFSASTKSSIAPPVPTVRPPVLTPAQKATALVETADRLREAQNYQKALTAYNQALQLQPKLTKASWGRCDTLVSLKQPEKAVVACDDALALQPDYAEALWSKGKALKQEEQTLEALSLFERATQLKPDFADAWAERGMTLQEVGRSVEALDALDRAIALDRNSAEAWSTRGAALWNLGRFDQAIVALDKALQIQPTATAAKALREKARAELGY